MKNKSLLGIQATKKEMHYLAVVKDNSFIINIPDQTPYELKGKRVSIVSEPFKQIVKGERKQSKPRELEFVLVVYHNRIFRVLNRFESITPPYHIIKELIPYNPLKY